VQVGITETRLPGCSLEPTSVTSAERGLEEMSDWGGVMHFEAPDESHLG
jgi:hypothetical protein